MHTSSENNVWSYSETAYQYAKAKEFDDQLTAEKIRLSSTPLEAYNLGRNVKGFVKERWMNKARDVMFGVCKAKFLQNPTLKNFLLATKDSTLIEANPRDKVWAVGLSVRDKDIFNKKGWKGENLLGNILMDIRGEIR